MGTQVYLAAETELGTSTPAQPKNSSKNTYVFTSKG